jgi:MinD-like ATPase involved in chromosome partitioning or flagellar assembly
MKICVLNLSGNVGKSTLAVHLLAAQAPGARLLSVESLNASAADTIEGLNVEAFSASRFRDIFREIMRHDEVIVDVGASNVAAFMTEIARFKSAVGEFDLVVVPTVPADKQQRDTIATIDWLNGLGVDGRRIRIVFNQYATETLEPVEQVYALLLGYALSDGKGKAVYEPHAVVERNEAFELAKGANRTIRELAGDDKDWKAARQEAKRNGDIDALEDVMTGQMTHDLAVTAQQNLDTVHRLLLGSKKRA